LEALQWHLTAAKDGAWERWERFDDTLWIDAIGPSYIMGESKEGRGMGHMVLMAATAVVLGMLIPGYRLVPEDVAQKAMPALVEAVKKHNADAERLTGCILEAPIHQAGELGRKADVHRDKVAALEALATALSPKKEANDIGSRT
jgi:hypothetical protein